MGRNAAMEQKWIEYVTPLDSVDGKTGTLDPARHSVGNLRGFLAIAEEEAPSFPAIANMAHSSMACASASAPSSAHTVSHGPTLEANLLSALPAREESRGDQAASVVAGKLGCVARAALEAVVTALSAKEAAGSDQGV